jgi:metal-sulfur cluster biosynthetic enzyme
VTDNNVTIKGGDSGLESARLVELAWKALSEVYDPELYIDVVSLGLVYGVKFDGDKIKVDMTLTTQGCPAAELLPIIAENAIVEALDGQVPVAINIVWDPPWDPSFMKPTQVD